MIKEYKKFLIWLMCFCGELLGMKVYFGSTFKSDKDVLVTMITFKQKEKDETI